MPRSLPTLTTRQSHVMTLEGRERSAGHRDARERGELLFDIEVEVTLRMLTSDVAHEALGLPPRALRDGSLSTDVLRAVLVLVRALPQPGWTR